VDADHRRGWTQIIGGKASKPETSRLLEKRNLTTQRYASAVYAAIVCQSVRPYVTSRSSTKKAKPRIKQTTPYDSLEEL